MLKKVRMETPRRLLFLFEIMTLILMFLYIKGDFEKFNPLTLVGLVLLVYISNKVLNRVSTGDKYILLIVSMLFSIGVMMIFRIDSHLGFKQLVWIIAGMIVFFMTYFIMKNIGKWENYLLLYIIGAYILFALTLALGSATKGAKNWIQLGPVSFQPAELIKILLIFILASFYGNQERYGQVKNASLLVMGVVYSYLALLFLQRDLGMALVFYGIFVCLQFVYEDKRRLLFYNVGLFIFGGLFGYKFFPHVRVRFVTWIDPWKYIDGMGYQITQSLFAIAEGGFFGRGIGRGYPAFIPEVHTDFIFSAICEEMGTLTGIGVIMLFLIFVYRGFKIALTQKNKFYRILALGISISFGIQIFIILGGVLKVIPLTGITLPFISYGGSSMVTSFIALGVLQRASEEIEGDIDEK